MPNSAYQDNLSNEIEQHAVIAHSQSIVAVRLPQAFDVTPQAFLQTLDFAQDLQSLSLRKFV
jgi:hypothetical protein